MHLLTGILVLLIGARLLGELLARFGQPRVVGEILAGVVLGPALLKIVAPSSQLEGISELSVFLIVVSAGLEMELRDVVAALRGRSLLAVVLAFVIPLVAGIALGLVFGLGSLRAIFLGLCLSVTALPVAVHILSGFGLLNSRIGKLAIATSIANDILALLFLGVVLDMPIEEGVGISLSDVGEGLLMSAGKLALFCLIVFVVSRLFVWGSGQNRIEKLIRKTQAFFGPEALFGIAVFFVLAFGTFGETLGTHFIIGAFFGALLLNRDVLGFSLFSELEKTIHSITAGFLAPIFFAFLGLNFGVEGLTSPFFLIGVLVVAVFAKVVAGWLGGRLMGFSESESLGLGIILNGRGIMELVVANIAFQRGLIGKDLFSVLVIMGVFTTVVTPILFRKYVLHRLPPEVFAGGNKKTPGELVAPSPKV